MYTLAVRVYGMKHHRQRMSFSESKHCDWSDDNNIRKVEILNSDVTGTNEYSILLITRNTEQECEDELEGQLSDGFFENMRVGKVEIITE